MSYTKSADEQSVSLANRAKALLSEHEHLIKYLIIGASASALDVILFLVLFNVVGTSELIAHSISVPTSILYSFLINARHNFKTNDYFVARLTSFFVVCGIGYAVGFGVILAVKSVLVSWGFTDAMGANIGKFASLPVVFIIQYVLNSRITFRKVSTQ